MNRCKYVVSLNANTGNNFMSETKSEVKDEKTIKADKKIFGKFKEYWESKEDYSEYSRKDIQKILDDRFTVPKDITEEKPAEKFYKEVRKVLDPRVAFGGMLIDFSKDKTMLKDLFPEQFSPQVMASVMWKHIKDNKLQVKPKEKKE